MIAGGVGDIGGHGVVIYVLKNFLTATVKYQIPDHETLNRHRNKTFLVHSKQHASKHIYILSCLESADFLSLAGGNSSKSGPFKLKQYCEQV